MSSSCFFLFKDNVFSKVWGGLRRKQYLPVCAGYGYSYTKGGLVEPDREIIPGPADLQTSGHVSRHLYFRDIIVLFRFSNLSVLMCIFRKFILVCG